MAGDGVLAASAAHPDSTHIERLSGGDAFAHVAATVSAIQSSEGSPKEPPCIVEDAEESTGFLGRWRTRIAAQGRRITQSCRKVATKAAELGKRAVQYYREHEDFRLGVECAVSAAVAGPAAIAVPFLSRAVVRAKQGDGCGAVRDVVDGTFALGTAGLSAAAVHAVAGGSAPLASAVVGAASSQVGRQLKVGDKAAQFTAEVYEGLPIDTRAAIKAVGVVTKTGVAAVEQAIPMVSTGAELAAYFVLPAVAVERTSAAIARGDAAEAASWALPEMAGRTGTAVCNAWTHRQKVIDAVCNPAQVAQGVAQKAKECWQRVTKHVKRHGGVTNTVLDAGASAVSAVSAAGSAAWTSVKTGTRILQQMRTDGPIKRIRKHIVAQPTREALQRLLSENHEIVTQPIGGAPATSHIQDYLPNTSAPDTAPVVEVSSVEAASVEAALVEASSAEASSVEVPSVEVSSTELKEKVANSFGELREFAPDLGAMFATAVAFVGIEKADFQDVLDCFKAARAGYANWDDWRKEASKPQNQRVEPQGHPVDKACFEELLMQMLRQKYHIGWFKLKIAHALYGILHSALASNLGHALTSLESLLNKGIQADNAHALIGWMKELIQGIRSSLDQQVSSAKDFARGVNANHQNGSSSAQDLSQFLGHLAQGMGRDGTLSLAALDEQLVARVVDFLLPAPASFLIQDLTLFITRPLATQRSVADHALRLLSYAFLLLPALLVLAALKLAEHKINRWIRDLIKRKALESGGVLQQGKAMFLEMIHPSEAQDASPLNTTLLNGLAGAWEQLAVILHDLQTTDSTENPKGILAQSPTLASLREPAMVKEKEGLVSDAKQILEQLILLSRIHSSQDQTHEGVQAALNQAHDEALAQFADDIRVITAVDLGEELSKRLNLPPSGVSLDHFLIDQVVVPGLAVAFEGVIEKLMRNDRLILTQVTNGLNKVTDLFSIQLPKADSPAKSQKKGPEVAVNEAPAVAAEEDHPSPASRYQRAWDEMLLQGGHYLSQCVLQAPEMAQRQKLRGVGHYYSAISSAMLETAHDQPLDGNTEVAVDQIRFGAYGSTTPYPSTRRSIRSLAADLTAFEEKCKLQQQMDALLAECRTSLQDPAAAFAKTIQSLQQSLGRVQKKISQHEALTLKEVDALYAMQEFSQQKRDLATLHIRELRQLDLLLTDQASSAPPLSADETQAPKTLCVTWIEQLKELPSRVDPYDMEAQLKEMLDDLETHSKRGAALSTRIQQFSRLYALLQQAPQQMAELEDILSGLSADNCIDQAKALQKHLASVRSLFCEIARDWVGMEQQARELEIELPLEQGQFTTTLNTLDAMIERVSSLPQQDPQVRATQGEIHRLEQAVLALERPTPQASNLRKVAHVRHALRQLPLSTTQQAGLSSTREWQNLQAALVSPSATTAKILTAFDRLVSLWDESPPQIEAFENTASLGRYLKKTQQRLHDMKPKPAEDLQAARSTLRKLLDDASDGLLDRRLRSQLELLVRDQNVPQPTALQTCLNRLASIRQPLDAARSATRHQQKQEVRDLRRSHIEIALPLLQNSWRKVAHHLAPQGECPARTADAQGRMILSSLAQLIGEEARLLEAAVMVLPPATRYQLEWVQEQLALGGVTQQLLNMIVEQHLPQAFAGTCPEGENPAEYTRRQLHAFITHVVHSVMHTYANRQFPAVLELLGNANVMGGVFNVVAAHTAQAVERMVS